MSEVEWRPTEYEGYEVSSDGSFVLFDQQTPQQEATGALQTVFKNGMLTKTYTFDEIRARLPSYL